MKTNRFLVLGAAVACACSSDPDPAPPPDDPLVCPGNLEGFRFPNGGNGSADPFGAKAASQARAGKITDAAQIVQPADAKHKVRIGDYVLANDKIAIYIEAEGRANGYSTFGGEIVGVDVVGADGRPLGLSRYVESLIMFSRQTVKPDKVSVLADGSDGGAAIVRVSGVLANVPFLDTFSTLITGEWNFPCAFDFVLEPGADEVKLRLSFVNTSTEAMTFANKQFVGLFQANRNNMFTEARGYAPPKGESSFVAFDGNESAFYVRSLVSNLGNELEVSGFNLFSMKNLDAQACETKAVDYLAIGVGAPGIDGMLEAKRRTFKEEAWRAIRGTVTRTGGATVANADVFATGADGKVLSRARTDGTGAYLIHVPAGAASLVPVAKGWAVPAGTAVADGATTANLVLAPHATIDVTATDSVTAAGMPVRVQILPQAPVPPASEALGLREERIGLWQEFAMNGRATLPVPPGTHRVIVSRGYEYELSDTLVTVAAGETAPVTAVLQKSVASPNVMCADFHIHSFYSADSSDPVAEKVKGAVADGLEIPVSSEHEWIIDFEPVIEQLGVGQWAFGMPSEELTTFAWGHFGVVPILPKPDQPNNGAVPWVGQKPPAFFKAVNDLPEKPVLIVNHPHTAGFGGYFSASGFDVTKLAGTDELWSSEFAALEIFNDADLEDVRGKELVSWFGLLNGGMNKWAVGSSDSHDMRRTPVGYPRTCLTFGFDNPRQLSVELVRDTLRSGAAVVSAGISMAARGPGGIGPGGTATAGAYTVTVDSPSWVNPDTLEVFVDGVSTETRPLGAPTGGGPGKHWEVTVDVQAIASRPRHFVVFHVKGQGDLAPLHPGRKPFAVSNPIFF